MTDRLRRQAAAQVAADFPDISPTFDPIQFHRLVDLCYRSLAAEAEAYDLAQRLRRCEMANLALGQAKGLIESHNLDCGHWSLGTRAVQLIRSAMTELSLAEVGAPNPEEMDTGPTATMLLQARGHLEIAQSISGPARQSVEVATELIDLALQDVAQLGLHLEQLKRQQG